MTRPPPSWGIKVYNNGGRCLKRLHNAGLTYNQDSREWHRSGLTEAQAKSLAGRMREAGLNVSLYTWDRAIERRIRKAQDRPYRPTPYDKERAENGIARAAARRDAKRNHPKDKAKKTPPRPSAP
jgi:hypothetical protein